MEDYESISTGETRKRKVYSIGFIITHEIIQWTGKWFQYVEIEEERFRERWLSFDEWDCMFGWGEWDYTWRFKKVIKQQ